MDRIRSPRMDSSYANEAEIAPRHRGRLDTVTGHETDTPNEPPTAEDTEIAEKAVGTRPVGDVSDVSDEGSEAKRHR